MVLSMKKNRMRKISIFILIAAILLTMQGFTVLAETSEPEQLENLTETTDEELEDETEAVEEEPEPPEDETETEEPEQEENEAETEGSEPPENETETEEPEQEENQTENLEDQTETENRSADNELTDAIMAQCIVRGQNPPGVIVNIFDYWQDIVHENGKDVREVAHDYYYWLDDTGANQELVTTYDLGISKGHLLRFGYTDTDGSCNACKEYGNRGAWNMYRSQTPYSGIVKTGLGTDGFPVLNLAGKRPEDYEQYYDTNTQKVLASTEESLAYLFSPYVSNSYKASYTNVQGLFQKREDGSYYYNSTKNFASYNRNTNSFILYNSPGVAKADSSAFCGQFFPFNTAKDVFDSYTQDDKGNIRLTYNNAANKSSGNNGNDYDPVEYGGNRYIKCYAPNLNHYLGMTMEMRFLQPKGGCLPNDADTPMTFKFSGDDDVWIFIDGVLVADLGGLHDACSLEIDFSNGSVHYIQENKTTTLLESFQAVYGSDSNPGGIEFNGDTFADNTVHTLKMFYLERGHMASNLNLDFNIQTLPIEQNGGGDPDGNPDENEEEEPYSEEENTDEDAVTTVESILPAVNNETPDNIEIPKTGDDSLIGWWAALSILSFIGISATVCNLILTRKKHSSKK